MILLITLFLFGGCSLAQNPVPSKSNIGDVLIGAYITEGYIDASEIGDTIHIDDGDFSVLYEEKKHIATIDKKGSENVGDWDVYFEGIPGIACFSPSHRYGEEEFDEVMYNVLDDEVVVEKNHFHSIEKNCH